MSGRTQITYGKREGEIEGRNGLEFAPDSNYLNGVPPRRGTTLSLRDAELKSSEPENLNDAPEASPQSAGHGRNAMENPPKGYAGVLKRPGFAYLLAAQALAVFDDNTFKQLLFLFAATVLEDPAKRNSVISLGTLLYVMPYIFLSSYAGQVADRFSKRGVIISLKIIEACILAYAAFATYQGHINAMLVALLLLGIHAAFLDPAKEGILPQIFPDAALSRANGMMQLTVYSMIVLGPVAAGFLNDAFHGEPFVPVAMLVGTALAGLVLALGVTRVEAISPGEKFRLNAAAEFWHDFAEIRASRALLQTVLAIAYFWFLGVVYLQNVIGYGRDLLHLSDSGIGALTAAVSVGIALGAFLAGKLSADNVELGLVPIGSVGLGVFGIALYFTSHSFALAMAGHFLVGFFGGIFIIPLQSFLQARAGEHSKGKVIAASNVLTFTGVALGAGFYKLLSVYGHLLPNQVLLVMGLISFAATVYIMTVLPDFTIRLCLWLLAHTFYSIRVRGAENLPKRGGALLVCNHISFVDPFLIGGCTQRFIRFLMYRRFYETRGIKWLAKLMGAIPISEVDKPRDLVASLHQAQEQLKQGELVCIFAEGSISRTGNLLRFRRGFERITKGMDVPIIPLHLDRVWGSIFSYERGRFFFKWPQQIPYPVTVTFGEPLPPSTDAYHVRQAVMRLSAEAFAHRDAAQRPLPELFVNAARRNWRRLCMADSSKRELSFGRALVGAALFRSLIERRCRDEKMIGVLLPPSVPTALLNAGISLSGRVPVNLNYTSSPEAMRIAIERCEIKTIFTTEKLLERLSIPKTPGMVMIEDVAKEFSGARKFFTLLGARLLPGPLLRRWLIARAIKLDSLATV
ncbi:MAG TPA: MFS transporter, partial [Terriglobia bacterium]|nr:MFS transporter [Terriglobia bacterium]